MIVGRNQVAADLRCRAQKGEEISRNQSAFDAQGIPNASQGVLVAAVAGDGLQRPSALAPGDHVRLGNSAAYAGALLFGHPHQPVGIVVGQWMDQQGIYGGKNRGGRPDSQRQSQHGCECKPGTAPQPAKPVAEILQERVEYRQAALIAIRLFRGFHATQLEDCLPTGFRGAHSRAEIVGDMQLEITFDLLGQFAVAPILAEQPGKATKENA